MTDKDTVPKKQSNQITKKVNVTDLTLNQRHQLFRNAMNQIGFNGFIKYQDNANNQTHYAFI
jgi:hypothetical protein